MPPAKVGRAWGPGEAGAAEGPVLGEGEEAWPLQAPAASPAVVPPAWLPRGDHTGDLTPSLASRLVQDAKVRGGGGESQLPLLWPGLESGLWGQTRKEGRQASVRRRAREWLPTWKTPCASADTAACSGVRPMLSCMLASALASSRRLAASERE